MTARRPQTEAELVDFVRAIDTPAPESLQRSVLALIAAKSDARKSTLARVFGGRSLRFAPALAGVGVLAVVAVVLALALSTGGAGAGPSLHQTAALTLAAATQPPPRESQLNRGHLAVVVDGVAFPYWEEQLGWRSTGARADRLGGRGVTTVYYGDRSGRHIGYAIVAGRPAPRVSGGTTAWREGIPYRVKRERGIAVVSWLRDGHLCVVSGRGVDQATLLRLASWHGAGAVPA
jgi:hypothetical protein